MITYLVELPVDSVLRKWPSFPAYLAFVGFLEGDPPPQAIADYGPSAEAQQRVSRLMARERDSGLSIEETLELDCFVELEHLIRMAKLRARQILARG